MAVENKRSSPYPEGSPQENFSSGLYSVDILGYGVKQEGKVRDSWDVPRSDLRVMVTTDRTSAYDRVIATIPGKGQVLNMLSAYWFDQTKDIIQNHVIAIPHPNVVIAKRAEQTLPVEVVVRGYMAKSSTSTSIYRNYNEGRRTIYGIDFPDGLVANQVFPDGPIITPTTKATTGHDEELTEEQAKQRVDRQLGWGYWDQTKIAALDIFQRASDIVSSRGLLLADTKFEFGIDAQKNLMLIDEVLTPDSSRYWLSESYDERMGKGLNPESFDKEILRRWLSDDAGYTGDGDVPEVDPAILQQMADAYKVPYKMIVGADIPQPYFPSEVLIDYTSPEQIRQRTITAVNDILRKQH